MNAESIFHQMVQRLDVLDDEQLERRSREFYVDHVDGWWSKIARDLPDWSWARFSNKSWESRCDGKLLDAVKRWPVFELDANTRKLSPRALVVTAPTGAGKSTAVLARLYMANDKLRQATIDGRARVKYPPPIAWYTEAQLLKASWNDDEQLERAKRIPLLVLDELGFAGGDQAAKGKTPVILDVLCARYDRGLATVITSGLSLDQIGVRYGSAIARRMQTNANVYDGAAK